MSDDPTSDTESGPAEDLVVELDERAADGRMPGRRGLATRQRLLDATAEQLGSCGYRDLKVIDIARAAGAAHVLLHGDADWAARVRELTAGRGVDVVYDSIGQDTFMASLECLRPRGLMVAYGNASGKPPPFDVLTLSRLGSLFLTRPRLSEYVASRADLEGAAARYFEVLERGIVRPHPVAHFALAEAGAAHEHLEDRATLSIPVLIP